MNAAFFRLWVPKIRAAARSAGIADFPIFGEVTLNDAVDLSDFARTRGLPQLLDFPFQQVASGYAAGAIGARGVGRRLDDDDYFRIANGVDPMFATFLGNHDMGRAAQQIVTPGAGALRRGAPEARRARLGPPVPAARRAGRPVGRRGRDDRLRRRPGGARGHVPDPGVRLADRSAGRRPADRQGILVRRHESAGSAPEAARRPAGRLSRALDRGIRRAARAGSGAGRLAHRRGDGHEVVVGFNNGTAAATVAVSTATPDATLARSSSARGRRKAA